MAEPGISEILYSTRAMRRLKPDPIPEATLKKIVDAGIRAPSGGNAQEWAFLLVRDPELKRFIRDYYWNTWQRIVGQEAFSASALPPPQQRMLNAGADLAAHLDEAPVLLLACAHKEYAPVAALNVPRASLLAVVHGSIFPAVQNILLACRALGIGATLTTIHSFFEEPLKQKLGVPDTMEIAAMIPMGYPRGKFGPVSRNPVEDVIHWDRWGQQHR